MKFKTSAIALAVAGTVAIPMAAQADIYASARIGLENVDTGGVSDLETKSFGSRFGARSETDLGNGMTGFGRYEWDVDLQDGESIKTRHSYVGLKGDFGSLTLGQAYHSYYNLVYGPTDAPWWGSGYFYPSPGRTEKGITYAGSAGAVAYSVTGNFERETEEESPDVTEAAVSFGIGDMTLGIGTRQFADYFDDPLTSNDESEGIVGVVLHGISLGDSSLGIGFQNQDEDDAFVINWAFGNFNVHLEQAMLDEADADPMSITIGYTQSLGRKTTAWYEVISADADGLDINEDGVGDSDDDMTTVRAVLKYDIE